MISGCCVVFGGKSFHVHALKQGGIERQQHIAEKMIKFVLMVNKQGQTRLAQYYDFLSIQERVALEAEIIRKCLGRNENQVVCFEDFSAACLWLLVACAWLLASGRCLFIARTDDACRCCRFVLPSARLSNTVGTKLFTDDMRRCFSLSA